MSIRHHIFRINKYIELKLEDGKTHIYVKGEKFRQCKSLALQISLERGSGKNEIQSIDELELMNMEKKSDLQITSEEEFWGHCSNLQAWVGNNYDTRLLHRNMAFPLLKRLSQEGDQKAKKVFKEEIVKRLKNGVPTVVKYLIEENYMDFLNEEELRTFFEFVVLNGNKIPVVNGMLDLSNREISDLKEIEGLYKLNSLRYLNLFNNKLEKLPASIKNLKSLQEINLMINRLESLPIEIGDLNGLKSLNLEHNMIETLPESIGNLKLLQNLNLICNELKSLPKSIGNLISLKVLDMDDNFLIGLPNSIGNLKSLEELYINNNQLEILPESLGNLNFLHSLSLQRNNICLLPESLGNLTSLRRLSMGSNHLEIIPDWLGILTELQELFLHENQIKYLPDSIGNLTSLHTLLLWSNHLKSLPKSIGNLSSLCKLYIGHNQLDSLPDSFENLTSLQMLDTTGNPMSKDLNSNIKSQINRLREKGALKKVFL
ncbi:MAG: hypothetical protein JW891_11740 [Candidatus Lokiarchaeota archaeon]|nr:hypothetical protein [Candidatus Lokiarchaeota archaeon]